MASPSFSAGTRGHLIPQAQFPTPAGVRGEVAGAEAVGIGRGGGPAPATQHETVHPVAGGPQLRGINGGAVPGRLREACVRARRQLSALITKRGAFSKAAAWPPNPCRRNGPLTTWPVGSPSRVLHERGFRGSGLGARGRHEITYQSSNPVNQSISKFIKFVLTPVDEGILTNVKLKILYLVHTTRPDNVHSTPHS